jgi:hypothetical protein
MWWTAALPDEGAGGTTVFSPDLSVLPYFLQTMEEIDEIRRGIATLVLAANRDNNGIAIHYSPLGTLAASLTASTLAAKGESWGLAITDVSHLLEDVGLQYDFICSEQIEAGELLNQRFKLLILPYSQALSRDEAEAMKAFVAAGGSLFAIGPAGTMDVHCRPLPVGRLAGLFPSGEAWASTDYGRGKAVYMGHKVTAQAVRKYTGAERQDWREKLDAQRDFASLLLQHGIHKTVTIRRANGTGLPPTEVSLFRQGQAAYIGLARPYFLEDHREFEASVRFPAKAHVYNMRTKKYLGMTDEFETVLDYRAQLYAALPYRVNGLQLNLDRRRYDAGDRIEFNAAIDLPDKEIDPVQHVVHLEMIDTEGRTIPYRRLNLATTNGTCAGGFLLSLNRKPGTYLIRATDVATGSRAERSVKICEIE